jgi:hypothetical protein
MKNQLVRLGSEHLHGHLPLRLQVLSELDRRQTVSTRFSLNGAPIG